MWWLVIGPLFIAADYGLGLKLQFFAVFVIPVTMAAWYSGRLAGLVLALGLPLVHLMLALALMGSRLALATSFENTAICMVVFTFIALGAARLCDHERRLQRQIHVLEGLLPICAFCKSIRDQKGDWLQLEQYIQERSNAKFSHGLCPHCVSEHYHDVPGQMLDEELSREETNSTH